MASRLPVGTWILCFIVVCGVAGSAHAVDRLVPQEYPTIQEGINAAQAGDIVLVSPGVYNELIDFLGKTITVRSSDGPAVTIIDGGGSGPIVTFQNLEGPGSVLEGFTITNGVAAEGAGITILDAYPTILNNTISGNTATSGPGGGILMRNYNPNIHPTLASRIMGNILSGNVAVASRGGGAYAYSSYEFPDFSYNTWSQNMAAANQPGTALYAKSQSGINNQIKINNETVLGSGNASNNAGSSIRILGPDLLIKDSTVQVENSTGWDSPAIESNNVTTQIENSEIRMIGNSPDQDQKSLGYLTADSLLLNNVTLRNQSSTERVFFDGYFPSDCVHANLNSTNLVSYGVTADFFSGNYGTSSTFILNDTVLIDATIRTDQSYAPTKTLLINGLNLSGTITGYDEGIDILAYDYYSDGNQIIEISDIVINDLTIQDSPGQIIEIDAWSPANTTIDISNVTITDLQVSESNPVALLDIEFENYGYQDQSKTLSLNNILVENPTSNSIPIYLRSETFYDSNYYDFTVQNNFQAENITLTGTPATEGSIILESLTYTIPLELEITNSIIEGPLPAKEIPIGDSNISFSSTLTSTPVDGENNFTGQANFVSGELGDYYLEQVASGGFTNSLGVDAGNPNKSAPFLGGTRGDGGLDTGYPDVGYHYPTKTEISSVTIELNDAAIFYEPGTGLIDSPFISMYLHETLPTGESPSDWRALSLRLLQESGTLQISSVQLSDEFLDSLGNPPDYFEALVCEDVVTVGLIPSLSDPSITFSLNAENEILQFEMTGGPDLASSTDIIETQWIPQDGPGCGGILDVANVVTDSLGNVTPLNRQPVRLTLVPSSLFQRGDSNTDGQTDLGDAVALLSFLFNSLGLLPCEDASDVNDDGLIDVADPIALLAALFTAGSPPSAPGQSCGGDPTPDTLRCDRYEVCTPTSSITSFTATSISDDVVQLDWTASGHVDQFQVVSNGIVHQRLAGSATGSVIRSLPSGLQDVCLWALAKGQIIEECVPVIASQPVTDLICLMDTHSPDAILEWVPQPGVDQLEVYSGSNLLAVVNAADLTAQVAIPQSMVLDLCLIGVTGQAVSASICCQIQTNDECYGAIPLVLGDNSILFEASTTSQTFYDSGECLSCWSHNPRTFFTDNGGDVWCSYEAEQTGVLFFNYSRDDMAIYNGECSSPTQLYCGSRIMRQVEIGDHFLIRVGGWIESNVILGLEFVDTLPTPFNNCIQGYDTDSGLYRVSWEGGFASNYFETMAISINGVETGSVAGTDGTFLIPGLVSGTTYEICITGQTGSLVSPPACQTVTIP